MQQPIALLFRISARSCQHTDCSWCYDCSGNNAMIILDDADLEMALRAVLFSAVGTAGNANSDELR